MGKNWLIRTKSNHILGPVSKEKVLDLYQNGSIKPDDELCSGNGYWFYLREKDLVDKYLIGNESQSFNPMSEAKDVLTSKTGHMLKEITQDDITSVRNLSELSAGVKEAHPHPSPSPKQEAPLATHNVDTPASPALAPADSKKKIKNEIKPKESATVHKKIHRKQNFLTYLSVLGFIILFLMIYFRKHIVQSLFRDEVSSTLSSFFLSQAHAQDGSPVKKKLLDEEVTIEKVSFRPLVGLSGFRVAASFDLDTFQCDLLQNQVYQLAIILYPVELFNEKFLLNVRNCIPKLGDDHPVKRWFKKISDIPRPTKKQQEKIDFLSEIFNSQFNLITDMKVKEKIAHILTFIKEETTSEKILKAYLLMIIGNITRSDNILKSIIDRPPREIWKGFSPNPPYLQQVTLSNLEKIFGKFSHHPTDRRTYELLCLYLSHFFNQPDLLKLAKDNLPKSGSLKLDIHYVYKTAPQFVSYLRLENMSLDRRIKSLRKFEEYQEDFQPYWVWTFLDVEPLISDSLVNILKKIEVTDPLWLSYLLRDEKVADLYAKKEGHNTVSGRRQTLRKQLEVKEDFMLALYQLLRMGDIDSGLIEKTSRFMIND